MKLLPYSRLLIAATAVTASLQLFAQGNPVESKSYNWADLTPITEESRVRRQVLDGTTTTLAQLEIHTSTLQPGKAPHSSHTHTDMEELIIVKEGQLQVTIKDQSKLLGPGSIAYALPGDEHGFVNGGTTPCTYYILKYKSKTAIDNARGQAAGGSFMIDWKDVAMTTTEKGARRNVFDRPTALFKRFEMHVTSLNKGLDSHAPHSHTLEEIILIRIGDTEMQVGEKVYPVKVGGLTFVDSKVLHNLRNVGDGQCEYYAFTWN